MPRKDVTGVRLNGEFHGPTIFVNCIQPSRGMLCRKKVLHEYNCGGFLRISRRKSDFTAWATFRHPNRF